MIIGLRRRPGQWRGEEIDGGRLEKGDHAVVTFRLGDTIISRAPNHYEAQRLRTSRSEAVVEVRRVDMTRETYRSSLVALCPEHGQLLVLEPEDQCPRIYVKNAGIVFVGKVDTPDHTRPQWRKVYEDIRNDIEAGRVNPGDRVPTMDHLVKMYGFSSTSTLKALQILQIEGWIEARSRIGRFVAVRQNDHDRRQND